MTKEEVKERLVFTHHGLDNLKWRRKYITIDEIADCVANGVIGFAGSYRFKKTLNNLTVIYKIDDEDNIVIITYYRDYRKLYPNVLDIKYK